MASLDLSSFSYHKFVEFAFQEAKLRADLIPFPSHEKFKSLRSKDNNIMLRTLSFHAPPKIRLIRSLTVEGNSGMQVLDFAVFPEPEFDLPIFCANFFATANLSIVVLDLNPLYDVTIDTAYKHKYYRELLPLGQKYFELLPWGGNITSESLRFFSPIVIWSRFSSSQFKYDVLYSAFMEYFKEDDWLKKDKYPWSYFPSARPVFSMRERGRQPGGSASASASAIVVHNLGRSAVLVPPLGTAAAKPWRWFCWTTCWKKQEDERRVLMLEIRKRKKKNLLLRREEAAAFSKKKTGRLDSLC